MISLGFCALLLSATAAPSAPSTEDERHLHPDVERLLIPAERNAAYARLWEAGVWRGPGTYTEREKNRVRHVVVCPQRSGPPLFAVFLDPPEGRSPWEEERAPVARGHYTFVAADGALVRVHSGNNLLEGALVDVDQDGVLDAVSDIHHGVSSGRSCNVLYVVPCTEAQRPSVRIAFQPRGLDNALLDERMSWALEIDQRTRAASLRIHGSNPEDAAELHEIARWDWSPELGEWVGPEGAVDGRFQRLPAGDADVDFQRFADAPR